MTQARFKTSLYIFFSFFLLTNLLFATNINGLAQSIAENSTISSTAASSVPASTTSSLNNNSVASITTSTSSAVSASENAMYSTSTSSSSTGERKVETEEFTGDITKIDGHKLTVKSDSETKEYTVPDNIKITKNTSTSKFEDLHTGDKVKMIIDKDKHEVISIDTISGKIFEWAKLIIPLLILGIILTIGIVYYLNKRNKGQIKTTASKIS